MTYTKYLFIPVNEPVRFERMNLLINQLYEALASPVSTIDTVHAGVDRTLSIRITYRMDGDDPDEDDNADTGK